MKNKIGGNQNLQRENEVSYSTAATLRPLDGYKKSENYYKRYVKQWINLWIGMRYVC